MTGGGTGEGTDGSAGAGADGSTDGSTGGGSARCELCEAAQVTEWFYEDDVCWIAECEQCAVPMAVWKRHDPNPPEEVRVVMKARLGTVVDSHYGFACWFDERMRTIPEHFHVHARPVGGFMGHGLRRG